MSSKADGIRDHALARYVRPWRRSGKRRLTICAGDVARDLRLRNATPNVCNALGGRKFQQAAGLVLVLREGPRASTTTTFHYESNELAVDRSSIGETGFVPPPSVPGFHPAQSGRTDGDEFRGADLCLVSCVKVKASFPAPARDLYVSGWFRKARALVEAKGCAWFVLSARYGLVVPDETIEPYDKTLNDMRAGERREWARGVLKDLELHLVGVKTVAFLAGAKYRETLAPELRARGIVVEIPMQGMSQGVQLSWLSRQRLA